MGWDANVPMERKAALAESKLAFVRKTHLARILEMHGNAVCSSRRANGFCKYEVQSHGKHGAF